MFGLDRLRAALPASGTPSAPVAKKKPAAAATIASDSRVANPDYTAVYQAASPAGRARLSKLQASGKLAEKDAKGQTLLANLAAIAALKPPSGAPYSAQNILDQTLEHLADPEVLNQSSRNTCGATTIQFLLLTQQPAEYARLVAGVAGPGKVAVQQGGDLVRVADSVAKDDTTRDDVERLMQSALMDYDGDYRGSYSNKTDRYEHDTGGLLGFLKKPVNWVFDKLGADLGLSEGMVTGLYEDILGKQAHVSGDLPGGQLLAPQFMRKGVYDEVAKVVKSGKPVPVDIMTKDLEDKPGEQVEHVLDQGDLSYSEKMLSHQVLVNKFENGRVYYRNPWGYQTSMSEAEFRSRMTDAVIPE